jgi:aminomethyltransferase
MRRPEPDTLSDQPRRTPLHDLHRELGARLVPFAGWEMPVQYPAGIIAEHQHCRAAAALFDVSHMGQVRVAGPGAAAAFERLVPGNIAGLKPGQARYTVFTNDRGGILDDLIVSNAGARTTCSWWSTRAAARRTSSTCARAWTPRSRSRSWPTGRSWRSRAGRRRRCWPASAPDCARLAFMSTAEMAVGGLPCRVSRLGYTGEDGFEISVATPTPRARPDAARERGGEARRPGRRDSLRLEAGLCLYGHDIDATTTPAEAVLAWTVPKRRREARDFPGAEVIVPQLVDGGPPRKLVGLKPDGRAPAREGAEVRDVATGRAVGRITSGGFGPSVGGPIAMGYVEAALAEPGPRSASSSAAKPCRPGSRPCRSCPTATTAERRDPMDVYYTKDHEWVRVEGEIGTVGISDHAQAQLGDVVFVELPEVGREIAQGQQAAVVESVKAASEVYAPVGGEVVERNERLDKDHKLVNEAAEGEGWFFKLRLKDPAEVGSLMNRAAYESYVATLT